jgi:hypothetical protein
MNLLFSRGQKEHMFSAPTFSLWTKFELTKEEEDLIDKYKPNAAVLSEDDPVNRTRKWRISLAVAGFLALLIAAGVSAYWKNPFFGVLALAVAWPVVTYLIFSQLREDVMVYDVITGRSFRCKSVDNLFQKENDIRQMAFKFREFLEAMKDWGGTETVRIEPGQPSALPRLEARR